MRIQIVRWEEADGQSGGFAFYHAKEEAERAYNTCKAKGCRVGWCGFDVKDGMTDSEILDYLSPPGMVSQICWYNDDDDCEDDSFDNDPLIV